MRKNLYSSLHVSRRAVVTGALGLAIAPQAALAEADWRKFAGETLEVNLVKSPRGDLLQRHEADFTALTGIKVNSEQTPEQQQRQKIVIELASGKPGFDVVHLSYHVQKRLMERGRWLAALTPFMVHGALAEAGHVEADYSAAGLAYAREKSVLLSLPWSVDYFMVYWNKALFEKNNLAFPASIDEMIAAAAALNDPASGVFGFVGRGMRNANIPLFMNFLLGFGIDAIGPDGQLQTDSREAIEAAKIYQTLLVNSGPPGAASFNWSECQTLFLQGKAAMWMDGAGFAPAGENPARSRIAGKIGYGLVPKGAVRQVSATFGDGLGVAAASKKQAAAFLYCQWAVSKTMGARLLQTGAGVPFRTSILNDPAVRNGLQMPRQWLDCVLASSDISRLGLPTILPVAEFRDIFGGALTATLSGGDPGDEMRKATALFRPILERSERG